MQQPISTSRVIAFGAALVLSASACDGEQALAPAPAEAAAEAADPSLVMEFGQGLHEALGDAIDRLAPALGEEVGSVVGGHLRDLRSALHAGRAGRARSSLRRVREAMRAMDDTPDSGAIGLVLEHTDLLLSQR